MNKIDRARQFLPFDALKGLQEEYRKKEIVFENKKELSEDSLSELEKEFNKIDIGSSVKIQYYKNRKYCSIVGLVTSIDYIKKRIQIDENENINVCDIVAIKKQ